MSTALLEAAEPLLILINARGDYLLNLPAVRAVCHLFAARLTVVVRRGVPAELYGGLPVRRFIEVDLDFTSPSLDRRFDGGSLARQIGGCDLLMSLNSWYAAPMARLLDGLRPRHSIGYHPTFDRALPLDFSKHNADLGFDLALALDATLRIDAFAGPPEVGADARRIAAAMLAAVPAGVTRLVLHGETKADKQWRPERFVAVLDRLLTRLERAVVLDVAYQRMAHDAGVRGDRVIPCAGLPLSAAMALIEGAAIFIGVDSCFLHAADLFRVPGVALFGPTDPHEFGFRFAEHRHVKGPSMDEIGVDEVAAAVENLQAELAGHGG